MKPLVYPTNNMLRVAESVLTERIAQANKWGEQHHSDGTDSPYFTDLANAYKDLNGEDATNWTNILLEEVYEALAESGEKLREELIQVAAVAAAWVEDIDSRKEQVD